MFKDLKGTITYKTSNKLKRKQLLNLIKEMDWQGPFLLIQENKNITVILTYEKIFA